MDMLNRKSPEWEKADQMAGNISRIKDKKAKRHQESLVIIQWLKALRGARG